MKVLVPNNLNVPELIEELNLSNRRQKYVKEKIYHLISRVVATHKNIKKFDKNGYTGLKSLIKMDTPDCVLKNSIRS